MQPDIKCGPINNIQGKSHSIFFLGAATIIIIMIFTFFLHIYWKKRKEKYQRTVQTPVGPMEQLTAEHIQLVCTNARSVKDIPGKLPLGTKGCFRVAWTTFLLSGLIQNRPLASTGFPPTMFGLVGNQVHNPNHWICVRVCVFQKTAEVTGY